MYKKYNLPLIALSVITVSITRPSFAQNVAVGAYLNTGLNTVPLSYSSSNGGASWGPAALRPPVPVDAAGTGNGTQLFSVSCDSTGMKCNAVGAYLNSRFNTVPLSYSSVNGGSSWSLSRVSPPVPIDAAGTGFGTQLFGISCDSSGVKCAAVGAYLNTRGYTVPLSYTTTNAGVNWSLSLVLPSVPVDAVGTGIGTQLFSISCDSTGAKCSAIGSYLTIYFNTVPLSYTSINGGVTWNLGLVRPPVPADALGTGFGTKLLGVD